MLRKPTGLCRNCTPLLGCSADSRAAGVPSESASGSLRKRARPSALQPSSGVQLRHSPVGFRSTFHCTVTPQWVVILEGTMEIGLQDGGTRVFGRGAHFYSADTLPAGAVFDAALHGHWSRQVGDEPLVTMFVRG